LHIKLIAYLVIVLAVVAGSIALLGFGFFLYGGPLGLHTFGLSFFNLLLFDTLLSCLFFLQHSGMIRRSFRMRVGWSRDSEGILFTIASSIPLILLVVFWQESDVLLISLQGASRYLSRFIFFLSVMGSLWAVAALGSFDSFGIQPLLARLRNREVKEQPFAIRGPYRWVRHPIYLFVLILIWSYPDLTADRLLFNVLWTIWIITGTVLEERDLVDHFGDNYIKYQKEVPMLLPYRLIPLRKSRR
jgi:protein-S-isoprenylcysteine O-methyltransferase Ste14